MDEIDCFIEGLAGDTKKRDARALLSIMEDESGYRPALTGTIIGFGHYHYRYESGREGEAAVVAFSPRKQHLVVYIMPGFDGCESLLNQLGKHKLGKSCLYINKLSDVDVSTLRKIIQSSVKLMQSRYVCRDS